MASIYCYSYAEPKLNLLGVVDDFKSFNFNRSYSGIGEWQLVIDGSTLNAQRVKGMNFIALADGVAGLVKHTEDIIEEGLHTITFSGVELKGLADKRIVIPPTGEAYEHYRQSPEYIIANLINNHIINPTDNKRRIYGSVAAYEEQDFKITYDGRYGNLAQEIEELATAYNIGWCASIIDSAIVWEIWQGVNRTASQTANNRLILDYDYSTMNNNSLIVEDGVPTYMVVAGQGEGTERAIHAIDKAETGLNRVETFLDARDIEDDSLLPQRGEEKLAEYGDTYNYTATLSNQAIKQYRTDFDLGDIGTIRDEKLAEPLDFRITSIEEVYEDNQITINIVFGYDKSLLKDAIKRMNSKRDALLAVEGYGSGGSGGCDCEPITTSSDEAGNVIVGGGCVSLEGAIIGGVDETTVDEKIATALEPYTQTANLLNLIYPVGSIYFTMSDINPSVIFGGTWAKTAAGRVLVGQYDDMEEFDTVGKYGGEFTHTLTKNEMPSHNHETIFNWPDTHDSRYTGSANAIKGSGTSNNCYAWVSNGYLLDIGVNKYTGGGQPHNNLQPYLVVNIWERKA